MQNDAVDTTGTVRPFPVAIPRTEGSGFLDAATLIPVIRDVQGALGNIKRRDEADELAAATSESARFGAHTLLEELREQGFSWRQVARLVGVSVPAVQKWRRGEGLSPVSHQRLAKLHGFVKLLTERRFLSDPVSWLELSLRPDLNLLLTGIDLLAADRYDLALELAGDEYSTASKDAVLDRFDSQWRDKYIDDAFDIFVDSEGVKAIRPRR